MTTPAPTQSAWSGGSSEKLLPPAAVRWSLRDSPSIFLVPGAEVTGRAAGCGTPAAGTCDGALDLGAGTSGPSSSAGANWRVSGPFVAAPAGAARTTPNTRL